MKKMIGALGAAFLLSACGLGLETTNGGNGSQQSAVDGTGSGDNGGGSTSGSGDNGTGSTGTGDGTGSGTTTGGDGDHDAGTGGTEPHYCSSDTNEATCVADPLGCRWLTTENRCQSLNDPAPDAGGDGSGGGSEPDAGPRI